jgi:hypothetical protein
MCSQSALCGSDRGFVRLFRFKIPPTKVLAVLMLAEIERNDAEGCHKGTSEFDVYNCATSVTNATEPFLFLANET